MGGVVLERGVRGSACERRGRGKNVKELTHQGGITIPYFANCEIKKAVNPLMIIRIPIK